MAKLKNDINPAQAAHKALKAKAIKKGRADVQAQRNERLAKRNPERLQRQIDELKSEKESGNLRPQDRARLDDLEKQLRAVNKAREALGGRAPQFRPLRRDNGDKGDEGSLGKRKRDDDKERRRDYRRHSRPGDESSETDEDVRDIPWPKDVENMPPIPRRNPPKNRPEAPQEHTEPHPLPPRPGGPPSTASKSAATWHRTTYGSAAQIRDLHAEALSAFAPQKKSPKPLVERKLLSPEEADRLELQQERKQKFEAEGPHAAQKVVNAAEKEAEHNVPDAEATAERADDVEEELRRMEQELDQVEGEDQNAPARGSAMADSERFMEEAAKEAEFRMMAEGEQTKSVAQQDRGAEKQLKVMIEEVSDEDL